MIAELYGSSSNCSLLVGSGSWLLRKLERKGCGKKVGEIPCDVYNHRALMNCAGELRYSSNFYSTKCTVNRRRRLQ